MEKSDEDENCRNRRKRRRCYSSWHFSRPDIATKGHITKTWYTDLNV